MENQTSEQSVNAAQDALPQPQVAQPAEPKVAEQPTPAFTVVSTQGVPSTGIEVPSTKKLWIGVFAAIILIGIGLAFFGRSALFKGSLQNDFAADCAANGKLEDDGRCFFEFQNDPYVPAGDLVALHAKIKEIFSQICQGGPDIIWNGTDVTCIYNNKTFENLNDFRKESVNIASLTDTCLFKIGAPGAKLLDNSDGGGIRCKFNGIEYSDSSALTNANTEVQDLQKTCSYNHGSFKLDKLDPDQPMTCIFDGNEYTENVTLEKAAAVAYNQLTEVCTSDYGKMLGLIFKDSEYCYRIEDDGTESSHFYADQVSFLVKAIDTYLEPVKNLCESSEILKANDAKWIADQKGCSVPFDPSKLFYNKNELADIGLAISKAIEKTCLENPTAVALKGTFDGNTFTCNLPGFSDVNYTSLSKLQESLLTEVKALKSTCTTDLIATKNKAEWGDAESVCILNGNKYFLVPDLQDALSKLGDAGEPAKMVEKKDIQIPNTPATLEGMCVNLKGTYDASDPNAPTCTHNGHVLKTLNDVRFYRVCTDASVGGKWMDTDPSSCEYKGKVYTSDKDLMAAIRAEAEAAAQVEVEQAPRPDIGTKTEVSPSKTATSDAQSPSKVEGVDANKEGVKEPVGVFSDNQPQQDLNLFEEECKRNQGKFANGVCTIENIGEFETKASLETGLAAYDECAAKEDVWDTDAKKCIPYAEVLAAEAAAEAAAKAAAEAAARQSRSSASTQTATATTTQSQQTGSTSSQVQSLQQQIAALQNQLNSTQSVSANQNSSQVDSLNQQIAQLNAQLSNARNSAASASDSGQTRSNTSSNTGSQTVQYHGAYIRGKTGPEMLLYPLAIIGANGALIVIKRRRKNPK